MRLPLATEFIQSSIKSIDELYFVNKFGNIPLRLVVNNEPYKATAIASLPKRNVFYKPAAIPVSSGSTQLSANPSTSPAVSPIADLS